MKVRIDYAICNSCGLCREVCPEGAIRPMLLEPRHLYEVQELKCTGCGECLEYCPAPGALVQYEPPPFPPLPGFDPGIAGEG
jgi:ferredoxin